METKPTFFLASGKKKKVKPLQIVPKGVFFIMELAFLPRQIFFVAYNPNSYSIVLQYESLKQIKSTGLFLSSK